MKIDRAFVEAKLSYVQRYYQELLEVLKRPDEDILSDFIVLRAVERLVQLIVDEMVDLNKYLIRTLFLKLPEDTQSTFYVLEEGGILDREFARKIAPVVGLRNRLVHRYEKVDSSIMLSHLRKNHQDFKRYINELLRYIDKGGK